MKYLKAIPIILLTIVANYSAYSQSIISTKTVKLRYGDQSGVLKIPVVSTKYPVLKKALAKQLFDPDDLKSTIANYKTCGCGTVGLDYAVMFENTKILSIKLEYETMGAYPDEYQKWLTYNKRNGKLYSLANEINTTRLRYIYKCYRDTLRRRIAEDTVVNKEEEASDYAYLKSAIDSLTRDELLHDYVFTKDGIVFTMDQILPHAVQVYEPDRDLFIPYEKLRRYKLPAAVVVK